MFERLGAPSARKPGRSIFPGRSTGYGDSVRSAFLEHGALVFRGQSLEDDHLAALGELFGPLERHLIENNDGRIMSAVHCITNFDAEGRPSSRPYINTNYFWHTDKSYLAVPSLATMLHPVELPPAGGDTSLPIWAWPTRRCRT